MTPVPAGARFGSNPRPELDLASSHCAHRPVRALLADNEGWQQGYAQIMKGRIAQGLAIVAGENHLGAHLYFPVVRSGQSPWPSRRAQTIIEAGKPFQVVGLLRLAMFGEKGR